MNDNTERELKMTLTEEQYNQIRKDFDFDSCFEQTNTYYDTPDHRLSSQRGAFRIRKLPDHNVITLKLPLDEITKQEYEYPTKANTPEELNAKERKLLKDKAGVDLPLQKIAGFTTQRCIKELPDAELCLDRTDFGNAVDYELEYEYSHDHDGISVFNQILARYGLKFEKNRLSKLGRAMNYSSNL